MVEMTRKYTRIAFSWGWVPLSLGQDYLLAGTGALLCRTPRPREIPQRELHESCPQCLEMLVSSPAQPIARVLVREGERCTTYEVIKGDCLPALLDKGTIRWKAVTRNRWSFSREDAVLQLSHKLDLMLHTAHANAFSNFPSFPSTYISYVLPLGRVFAVSLEAPTK